MSVYVLDNVSVNAGDIIRFETNENGRVFVRQGQLGTECGIHRSAKRGIQLGFQRRTRGGLGCLWRDIEHRRGNGFERTQSDVDRNRPPHPIVESAAPQCRNGIDGDRTNEQCHEQHYGKDLLHHHLLDRSKRIEGAAVHGAAEQRVHDIHDRYGVESAVDRRGQLAAGRSDRHDRANEYRQYRRLGNWRSLCEPAARRRLRRPIGELLQLSARRRVAVPRFHRGAAQPQRIQRNARSGAKASRPLSSRERIR